MSFKRLLGISILLFLSFQVLAQRPGGISITGKVLEGSNQDPIPYAAIALLMAESDSIVTGGLTDEKGKFSLSGLRPGKYRLSISFMGFSKKVMPIELAPGSPVNLGNILLIPDNQVLNEVEVSAEKEMMTMQVDRKVFNVSKDISTQGGTAIDAMKNIPSLLVESDGSVTIRNASPMIFVDGRPTTLTLEQIPADEIERIEVITNPSARFDASATGGILNIVLKKNLAPGYNGMVILGAGTGRERYNGMASLNVRLGKWNVNSSFSLNSRDVPTDAMTEQTNLQNGEPTGGYKQEALNNRYRKFQFGRLGIDYSLSNSSTLFLEQNLTSGDFNNNEEQNFTYFDGQGIQTGTGLQLNDTKYDWRNYSSKIGYRFQPSDMSQEFMADFTYNHSERNSLATYTTYQSDLPPNEPIILDQDGYGKTNQFTFQADYVKKLADGSRFEAGVKNFGSLSRSTLNARRFDYGRDSYVPDSLLSNDFDLREWVHAAYLNYITRIGDYSLQAGFRYEQSILDGKQLLTNEEFSYNYPSDWDNLMNAIFPSIFVSRKFGSHEIQLNLARKIDRPNWWQVTPYVQFTDRQNVRQGNPGLAPEFITVSEVNHNYVYKGGNFLQTIYFRSTDNVITDYVYPFAEDSTILVSTFINGNSNYNVGYEASWQHNVTEKLSINLNGNIQYSLISATTDEGEIRNEGWNGFGKATVRYKFPWKIEFQASGTYRAPRITPQGRTNEMAYLDLNLQKKFKHNLTLTVEFEDVFNSQRWGGEYITPSFTQEYYRRWDIRNVSLRLSWNFGERDPKLFRSLIRRERGGGGGEGEGF
ncbi:MAG: TonB-dependent receptor family protein [Bacteroidota bacterium]|nr:TonB-dependent receptor family protein [Bacteroidota bacterium]MDX5428620.1 TonB-dependent receptor family protein [Bacteroidota bacterium]MDX5506361.1 TonB-dependent receptor family protein [Bacteroidota bacterium]